MSVDHVIRNFNDAADWEQFKASPCWRQLAEEITRERDTAREQCYQHIDPVQNAAELRAYQMVQERLTAMLNRPQEIIESLRALD